MNSKVTTLHPSPLLSVPKGNERRERQKRKNVRSICTLEVYTGADVIVSSAIHAVVCLSC